VVAVAVADAVAVANPNVTCIGLIPTGELVAGQLSTHPSTNATPAIEAVVEQSGEEVYLAYTGEA
jgi:hypothetical protein